MTTREMRCPHKAKISDCSECMAELNAIGAPATEEEFLREFQQALADAKNTSEWEKIIKGWASLLKLRMDAERLDEINLISEKYGSYSDGCGCCSSETIRAWNDDTDRYDGEIRSKWLQDRIAQLTNPNHTPKEG